MQTVLFYIFVFLFLHKWLFVYKSGNVFCYCHNICFHVLYLTVGCNGNSWPMMQITHEVSLSFPLFLCGFLQGVYVCFFDYEQNKWFFKKLLVAIFKDSPLINNWAFSSHPKCIFQGFSFYSQNCELEILNLSQNEWAIHKNRPTLLISLQLPASKLCLSLWAVTMCLYTLLVTIKLKRWELYRPEFVYFVALFHDDKYDDLAPLYSHSAPASLTDPEQ